MSSEKTMETKNRLNYFYKEIRGLRKSLNLTQKAVADAIGITIQSYQAYEWGLTLPILENFIKLCDFFQVTPDYLLGYKDGLLPS